MTTYTKTLHFKNRMIRQPDGADLGEKKGSINLSINLEEYHGAAEFEVPSLDYYAEIGLWFARQDGGTNTHPEPLTQYQEGEVELVDYDGTHALPVELIKELRDLGIKVDSDFE